MLVVSIIFHPHDLGYAFAAHTRSSQTLTPMKKTILLFSLLMALVTASFGQGMIEYANDEFSLNYPEGWTLEEDVEANLAKFTSPDEQGIFQLIISPSNGYTALELLDDWITRTGYTNINSEAETNMSADDISAYGAHDGATGMFEPVEDGIDLFMNVDVYIKGEIAYFLIATTTVNDPSGNVKLLGTMAGSFRLAD